MRVLLQILLALYCAQVWGWGFDGHKIVGQIADKNLTPEARKNISLLLGNDSLASVSTWADIVKFTPVYYHTSDWHFFDLPDNYQPPRNNQYPASNVARAIVDMTQILKDPLKDEGEKRRALKFLIHFVGDIHQPLHVGRVEDRGGNDVDVSYNGHHMSLHELWDTELISEAKMDYKKYAQYLESYYTFSGPAQMMNFSFVEVFVEDIGARKAIYDFPPETKGEIMLDKRYLALNQEFLNRSLYLGGKRLAALLNGLFKN